VTRPPSPCHAQRRIARGDSPGDRAGNLSHRSGPITQPVPVIGLIGRPPDQLNELLPPPRNCILNNKAKKQAWLYLKVGGRRSEVRIKQKRKPGTDECAHRGPTMD